MRRLLIAFALLLLAGNAQAQTYIFSGATQPAPTGNPIGVGQSAITLFANSSPASQIATPFSFSLWTKQTAGQLSALLRNSNAYLGYSNDGTDTLDLQGVVVPGFTGSLCAVPGTGGGVRLCTRVSYVQDGSWHHLCAIYNGAASFLYLDGQQADNPPTLGAYTPTSSFWTMNTGGASLRDVGVYNRALAATECQRIYNRGVFGYNLASGNAGSLTTGLVAWWNLDPSTCTGSGTTLSCTDGSGNNNPAGPDTAAPSVAITAPVAGTYSGTINLQASCTDTITCTSVTWYFDGTPLGTQTNSPFTLSVNTAQYVDGSHTIGAVAINPGGTTDTATPVTITTSNGVSNKTVYIDLTGGGSDSNDCLTLSTQCATFTKANSFTYYGGDTISLKPGSGTINNPTRSTTLTLVGPSSNSGIAQNVYPGLPITITTQSGTCAPLAGTLTGCAVVNITGAWPIDQFIAPGVITIINIPRFNIQNIECVGTASSDATNNANCINAIGMGGSTYNGTTIAGTPNSVIQNIYSIDMQKGVYPANTASVYYESFAEPNGLANLTIQYSLFTGSTRTSQAQWGILAQGANNLTAQFNECYYIGGTNADASPGNGSCILFSNAGGQAGNVLSTMYANVAHDNGGVNHNCGASYGFWTYSQSNTVISSNEVYLQGTNPWAGGCDQGGLDTDGGSTFVNMEYNYVHENDGPGWEGFNVAANGQQWTQNTVRYNIFENNGTDGFAPNFGTGIGSNFTNTQVLYIYNNTSWFNPTIISGGGPLGCTNPPQTHSCSQGFAYGTCPGGAGSVFANNIMMQGQNPVDSSIRYIFNNIYICPAVVFKSNGWYPTGGAGVISHQQWIWLSTYTTLAAWQAAVNGGDTNALNTNPSFTGSGGSGGNCYTDGSGNPVAPGSIPCPTNYELTGGGYKDAGIDLTQPPYNINVGTQDFYGKTIPTGSGTGYPIGASTGH